jgi:hypothetical protein
MQRSDADRTPAVAQHQTERATAPLRYLNAARLLLLPIAILSVVVLARDGFRIPLNVYFDRLLDVYDDTFGTVAVLIEPAIKAVLSIVGQWVQIKLILLPHWKYVFVLWWLVFGTIARTIVAHGARTNATVWYAWGALCALLGGVVAGLAPLSSVGFLLSSSGLFLYMCGVNMYAAIQDGLTVRNGVMAIVGALILAIGVSSPAGIFYDPRAEGFGLKVLLTTIALFAVGIAMVAIGPARYRAASTGSFWREYLSDHEVTGALDVLTVLGSAAILVCVAYLAG